MKQLLTLLVLSMTLLPATSLAQQTHKITIENGRVFVDGRQVTRSELPASLDPTGLKGTFNFWSDDKALIEIKNHVYEVRDGRLLEAKEQEVESGNIMVFFSSENDAFPLKVFRAEQQGVLVKKDNEPVEVYLRALKNQAQEMDSIRVRFESKPDANPSVMVREIVAQAERAARIAEALPQAQFQAYLHEIQDTDQQLYSQLRLEHQMEMESQQLAAKLATARTNRDKQRIRRDLEAKLSDIFDLKQQNRAREVQQLSQQLEDLRTRLRAREDQRSALIERRIEELLAMHKR